MSSLALSYVVNLLARREYSEFELRNKMQEKAFTEDEIDETIAYCQKKTGKMINDLLKLFTHTFAAWIWCKSYQTRITSTERCIFRRNQ